MLLRTHAFSLLVLCYPLHTGFLSSSFFLHGCKMAFAAFPNPLSFPLSLNHGGKYCPNVPLPRLTLKSHCLTGTQGNL